MANRTEYGLAAYFYTRDLARAWRVAEELEFGEDGRREGGADNGSALMEDGLDGLDGGWPYPHGGWRGPRPRMAGGRAAGVGLREQEA